MKESHSNSRSKAALGGKKSKSGKHPHEIRIRHGKNGGHIVTHHFAADENGATPEPEENVLPDKASLMQHIDQNVPDNPAPSAAPPEMAQAGPAAGPAPQPGM